MMTAASPTYLTPSTEVESPTRPGAGHQCRSGGKLLAFSALLRTPRAQLRAGCEARVGVGTKYVGERAWVTGCN